MKIIDIGHSNYPLDRAISILETAISQTMFEKGAQVIKIIHGHGTGALRKEIRQWCREQEGRFQAVIHGEDYDLFHEESMAMRVACGQPYDPDLGRQNRAVTYLWLW